MANTNLSPFGKGTYIFSIRQGMRYSAIVIWADGRRKSGLFYSISDAENFVRFLLYGTIIFQA
jgi:hypothetical protein